MTTHTANFGATTGETLTAKLMNLSADTVAYTADSVTERTNAKGRYNAVFDEVSGVTAGAYLLVYFSGSVALGSEWFDFAGTDGEFVVPRSEQAASGASAEAIATQVRTELTTELGRIDAAITTRSTLDAAGVRTAIGLATANLDTQLSTIDGVVDAILLDTAALPAFPTNFASLAINTSGHVSRVTLVDTTAVNSDMRGTDSALLAASYSAPPAVGAIADAVWDEATAGHATAETYGKAIADGVTAWITATGFATAVEMAKVVKSGESRTISRTGQTSITFTETRA